MVRANRSPSLYFYATFDFFSATYFFIARRFFCLLRLCKFFRASCFMLILLVPDKPDVCGSEYGERLGTHAGLESWWLPGHHLGAAF